MTMQNLLQQCRKKSLSKVLRFWVVLAAVALLLVLACRGYDWDALGRYKGDNISSLHYVRGRVVEVLRDDTKPDQLDPARSMGTQELRILLLEGANKGTEVTIANYLTRTQNVRLRQGETAIICEDLPDSADAYYTVYNYDRAPVLVLIVACIWYLVITSILMIIQSRLEKHFGKGFDARPAGARGKQTPLPGKTEGEPQDDINKQNEATFAGMNA